MMDVGIRTDTQVEALTVMWSIIGLSIAAAIIYAAVSRERRLAGPHNLGSLSAQWVAEHRAHQSADELRGR